MSKILIVEDEEAIADLERDYLELSGFTVEVANDGDTGLQKALNEDYDLLILDLMLPGTDGFDICRQVRDVKNTPIVMVSAKKDDIDKIRGLGLGADDYIVKPFEIEELLARVEAVLRRTGRGGQTLTAFDVTLDSVARPVTQQGKAVELTPREFDLLEQLMRNRGAALYRDVLYGRVWGGDLLDSRTLDLHIQRLRKKLGWADKIETVYRVGYRLKSDQK